MEIKEKEGQNSPTSKEISIESREGQEALIKRIIAKNCTAEEVQLLLYYSRKYGLDPLTKQIWAIKRNAQDPALIFCSRDGYIKIAHDSGQFDGMTTEIVRGPDGKTIGARCTVYRKDMKHPFISEVSLKEYKRDTAIWSKLEDTMICKVSEVHSLKHGFPISGMITEEEAGIGGENLVRSSVRVVLDAEAEGSRRHEDRFIGFIESAKNSGELIQQKNSVSENTSEAFYKKLETLQAAEEKSEIL